MRCNGVSAREGHWHRKEEVEPHSGFALVCRIARVDVRSVTKAGYEQACAGIDFGGTQVGAYNYSVTLAIQESERNRLTTLREFAAEHDLQFFDFRQGSSSFPVRRMACSLRAACTFTPT